MHKLLFLIFFIPTNLFACYRVMYAELKEPKTIPPFIVHLSRLSQIVRPEQVSFFQRIDHILNCKEPTSLQCQAIRALIKKRPIEEQDLCVVSTDLKEEIFLQEQLMNEYYADISLCLKRGNYGAYRENESSCIFDILIDFAAREKTSFYFLETVRLMGQLKKEWFDRGFASYGHVHNTVGEELLVRSVENGNYHFVKWLFKFGINPNYSNANGSMIEYAIRKNRPDIIKLLIESGASVAKLNLQNCSRSPLWTACTGNVTRSASMLVSLGANVNELEHQNYSILMATAKDGNAECTDLLLQHGAKVDFKDKKGRTALFYASEGQYSVPSAALLLKYKAEVDARDLRLTTSLMYACERGNLQGVQLLLHAGAEVNAKDSSGRSPLFHALDAYANVFSIVKTLRENHADIDTVDNSRLHVIDRALERYKFYRDCPSSANKYEKVLNYLISEKPKITFSTRLAVLYHLNRKKVWCSAFGVSAIAGGFYLYHKKNS